jgi:hypothetical protein
VFFSINIDSVLGGRLIGFVNFKTPPFFKASFNYSLDDILVELSPHPTTT